MSEERSKGQLGQMLQEMRAGWRRFTKLPLQWRILSGAGVVAILVVGLFLVRPSDDGEEKLTGIAEDTCAELEGAIVLQASGILNKGIREAEREGFTAAELGDAMRRQCLDLMLALEGIAEEADRREALPSQMRVEVDYCGLREATGRVTNDSLVTVDVFIDVQFLDSDGVVVDDSIGSISGLRPGETGKWDAPYLGDSSYERCRAEVGSVFEQ